MQILREKNISGEPDANYEKKIIFLNIFVHNLQHNTCTDGMGHSDVKRDVYLSNAN